MWELVKAGGWLMLPLVLCSIFTVRAFYSLEENYYFTERFAIKPSAKRTNGFA